MRYLVTGACGFIGQHLVRRLLNEGHSVYAVDYRNIGCFDDIVFGDNLHVYCIDITGENSLDCFLETNLDGVFHLAATPRVQLSFDKPLDTTRNNTMSHVNVLEFVRKKQIPMVFASSSTAKNKLSPYGAQKAFCEDLNRIYTEKYNLKIMNLRYHSIYGPGMDTDGEYTLLIPRLIHCALSGEVFKLYGDGTQMRDFTYIDDCIDTTVMFMKILQDEDISYRGNSIDVGFGNPISVNEIIYIVEEVTGKKILINKERARTEELITKANTQNIRYHNMSPYKDIREGIEEVYKQWKK